MSNAGRKLIGRSGSLQICSKEIVKAAKLNRYPRWILPTKTNFSEASPEGLPRIVASSLQAYYGGYLHHEYVMSIHPYI
jgi:hypothetical protein